MPNWCEIDITISGSERAVTHFERILRGGTDSNGETSLLGIFLPRPEALENTVSPRRVPYNENEIAAAEEAEKAAMLKDNEAHAESVEQLLKTCGAADWYEWSIQNWGVKWPDRTRAQARKARSLLLSGVCPWAPPLQGFETISEMFPELRFKIAWFECGMGFSGRAAYKAGNQLYYEERNYRGGRGG
jgi:hypothetical protein